METATITLISSKLVTVIGVLWSSIIQRIIKTQTQISNLDFIPIQFFVKEEYGMPLVN